MRALTLLAMFAAGAAQAAEATPEGAKAIADNYAAYVSRAAVDQGIVTVAPRGEDYLVTWDLQKAIDRAESSDDTMHIEPFSYVLTEGASGVWTMSADRFPAISFDFTSGQAKIGGRLEAPGFALKGVYDADATQWLQTALRADSLAIRMHVAEGTTGGDEKFDVVAPALELRARNAADGAGVDVAAAYQNASASGTNSAPILGGGGPPPFVSFGFAGDTAAYGVKSLRASEIGDLWKALIARAQSPTPDSMTDELRARLRAVLPVWKQFELELEDHDVRVSWPDFNVTAKSLGESLGFSGLGSEGGAHFSMDIADAAVASPLAPPWVASLLPVSLNIDARVVVQGLDTVAQVALDDPEFGKGDLSSETEDKITAILLGGGSKIIIAPSSLTTPTIDLGVEGEISVNPASPGGRVVISANSLDKTTALLQDLVPSIPQAQQILLGVAYLKGLSTTDANGRLIWAIELKGNDVVVNGQPMPRGD